MFSKFKNFLNSLKRKSFQVRFTSSCVTGRFAGILLKVNSFWVIGVTAILLPSLVYICPVFSGQVVSEDLKSFQVAEDVSSLQKLIKSSVASFTVRDTSVVLQENKFREKGVSEICGCFVEFNDIVKFEGISVSNPRTKEHANDSETASNECYFVGTKIQFWLAILLGGLFGAIIGTIIVQFIFLFLHNGCRFSRSCRPTHFTRSAQPHRAGCRPVNGC
jgi:hypothetical protein